MLAACPDAFARLVGARRVAFVSATNGKTTTTRFLAAALRAVAPVLTNDSGANMPAGLVAALARPPARLPASAPAVLEADETYLPGLLQQLAGADPGAAPLLVLGNLTRDQLDRVAEVALVARKWRAVFATMPRLSAVANADDPHVVWAAAELAEVTWVAAGQSWTADAALCPACGAVLHRQPEAGGQLGWSCGCGFARPRPSWWLDGTTLMAPDGAGHPLELSLPGGANLANAAMAVAAAAALGVRPEIAVPALRSVQSVGGRYQVATFGGRRVRLLLGKNPAGWAEMFGMLAPAPAPVVIAINARAADGKDPSWLWDVPFEKLADRFVVATGERRHDLAVRLLYAGVPHATIADPWASDAGWPAEVAAAGLAGAENAPLDAVGTYTAFRELLRRVGGADDAG